MHGKDCKEWLAAKSYLQWCSHFMFHQGLVILAFKQNYAAGKYGACCATLLRQKIKLQSVGLSFRRITSIKFWFLAEYFGDERRGNFDSGRKWWHNAHWKCQGTRGQMHTALFGYVTATSFFLPKVMGRENSLYFQKSLVTC